MGKWPDEVGVADGPQPLAGAQVVVDWDAVGLRLDADGFQADAVDAGAPAGGHEQAIAAQVCAVGED
jgi:hypothetical protein